MISLENSIIKLRALEPEDISYLYNWENDTSIWGYSDTITPFSQFQLEQYIASEGDIYTNKQLRLMIEIKEPKITIGCIDLFDFNPFHLRAGIGILIYPIEYRGKGYASNAIELIKNYAFTILGLKQLYCNVNVDNTASVLCMQKSGFEIAGVKKAWNKTPEGWVDEYILQCFNLT